MERRFGFKFGPDHLELLTEVLPIGQRWPDWRNDSDAKLRDMLGSPTDGVLFDITSNAFWPSGWGNRPPNMSDALELGRRRMREVPTLVPVYSHRFLPAAPCEARSPVFSVHQTDVIYYGLDLEDYLIREWQDPRRPMDSFPLVKVPFWSELAEGREEEI